MREQKRSDQEHDEANTDDHGAHRHAPILAAHATVLRLTEFRRRYRLPVESEGRWLARPRPSLPETFRGTGHHGFLLVSGCLVGLLAGGLSGLLGGPGFGSSWANASAVIGGLLLLAGVLLYLRRPVERRPAAR